MTEEADPRDDEQDGAPSSPHPGSILAEHTARRRPTEAPQHPKLAATLLMVGVVVLLALIGLSPLLSR